MKLYDVPEYRKIKIKIIDENVKSPPSSLAQRAGDVLEFKKIDGMYSLCYDKEQNPVYIAAWTEVDIVNTFKKQLLIENNIS